MNQLPGSQKRLIADPRDPRQLLLFQLTKPAPPWKGPAPMPEEPERAAQFGESEIVFTEDEDVPF